MVFILVFIIGRVGGVSSPSMDPSWRIARNQRPPELEACGLIQEVGRTRTELGILEEEERRESSVEDERIDCSGQCMHCAASDRNHLGSNALHLQLFPLSKDE